MYRKQEGGLETCQIGNYTDNHSCVCLTEYTACNCFIYFISVAENAYHSILAHNGNQQAMNRKDELQEGQIFTQIFGRIFATEQRTDLASSLFAVKYTMIVRQP
jgi:hypothetical protein